MANKPPALTPQQRADALAKARHARAVRADVRQRLKTGKIGLSQAIDLRDDEEIGEAVGRMKVLTLIETLPGIGEIKAQRIMNELGIAQSRRLRGLGTRQREALEERLG